MKLVILYNLFKLIPQLLFHHTRHTNFEEVDTDEVGKTQLQFLIQVFLLLKCLLFVEITIICMPHIIIGSHYSLAISRPFVITVHSKVSLIFFVYQRIIALQLSYIIFEVAKKAPAIKYLSFTSGYEGHADIIAINYQTE